jgi:hypothetical protein
MHRTAVRSLELNDAFLFLQLMAARVARSARARAAGAVQAPQRSRSQAKALDEPVKLFFLVAIVARDSSQRATAKRLRSVVGLAYMYAAHSGRHGIDLVRGMT